jgi:hypothetical protein
METDSPRFCLRNKKVIKKPIQVAKAPAQLNFAENELTSIPADTSSSTRVNESIQSSSRINESFQSFEEADVFEHFSNLNLSGDESICSNKSKKPVDRFCQSSNESKSTSEEKWFLTENSWGGYKVK